MRPTRDTIKYTAGADAQVITASAPEQNTRTDEVVGDDGAPPLGLGRLALVLAPVTAAVLIVAGVFLDPAIDASGRALAREYAQEPGRTQLSSLSFHFAYASLIIPMFAVIPAVRDRSPRLAGTAVALAALGMTTLPGFLLTDYYDIAIHGELGGDAWDAVNGRVQELPGTMVMFLTAAVGFLFALPVALLAAWRARLLPWWPSFVTAAGAICAQAVPGGYGLLLWAGALAALSYAFVGTRRPTARNL